MPNSLDTKTPMELVQWLKLQGGLKNDAIAAEVGVSRSLITKLASGERTMPSYVVMDRLRNLCAKTAKLRDKP